MDRWMDRWMNQKSRAKPSPRALTLAHILAYTLAYTIAYTLPKPTHITLSHEICFPELTSTEKSESEARLRKAICQGDDKEVMRILEEYPDINIDAVDNVNQFTMLHYAGRSSCVCIAVPYCIGSEMAVRSPVVVLMSTPR